MQPVPPVLHTIRPTRLLVQKSEHYIGEFQSPGSSSCLPRCQWAQRTLIEAEAVLPVVAESVYRPNKTIWQCIGTFHYSTVNVIMNSIDHLPHAELRLPLALQWLILAHGFLGFADSFQSYPFPQLRQRRFLRHAQVRCDVHAPVGIVRVLHSELLDRVSGFVDVRAAGERQSYLVPQGLPAVV